MTFRRKHKLPPIHLINKILKVIYTDPSDAGSFGGVDRLWRQAQKFIGLSGLRRSDVERFLKSQDVYTHYKQIRHHFTRNPIIVNGIDDQWQADLADMVDIAKYNSGYRYLLTVVDCFSKYGWAVPVKTKDAKSISEAFFELLRLSAPRVPKKLQTDKGKEFLNKDVQNFLKSRGIHHFVTENETKAAMVERFNRTIKSRIFRYLNSDNRLEYLKALPLILDSYNNSKHRAIGMSPKEVSKSNEEQIWHRLYGQYAAEVRGPAAKRKLNKSEREMQPGSTVRISKSKTIYDKGYLPNWTGEIFQIVEREMNRHRPLYKLKDYDDESIKGEFYPEELQIVTDLGDYKVEKVLKKRKTKEEPQVLVKWRGWPAKFNSWIPESELKTKSKTQ